MSQELLPCPFCGGEAVESKGIKGDGTPWLYIECLDCAAAAEPESWNKRHEPPDEARWKKLKKATVTAHDNLRDAANGADTNHQRDMHHAKADGYTWVLNKMDELEKEAQNG